MSTSPLPLHGVIPALVTPRDEATNDVDVLRLAEFTRHLLTTGIHGIFPTSSTGEAALLSRDQRMRVIKTVAEVVSGVIPVLGNAGAATTERSIRLAQDAASAGATHLAILPMHFVPLSPDELYGYFAAVSDSVDLPTVLYNYPARTNGQNIPASVVARLSEKHRVVGIKDSSGSLANTLGYLHACGPEFSVFIGQETLILSLLAVGGAGTICAAANVVPERIVALYKAWRRGDLAEARRHQEALLVLPGIFGRGTFPASVKAALAGVGQAVGDPFPPVMPLSTASVEDIRSIVQNIIRDN